MCLIFKKNCYILVPEMIIAKFNISGDKTIEICQLSNKFLCKDTLLVCPCFVISINYVKTFKKLYFYNVQITSCTL